MSPVAIRLLAVASACIALSGCGGSGGDEEPTPPAAPTGLTATAAGHDRIDLAWTDRSGDETGFEIERSATSATAGFAALHAVAAGETLWADASVSPATRYWYRVRATNAVGDSAWSNVADATTGPSPVVAPTELEAMATGPNEVALTWVDNSTNEDGFEVQRSATSATAGFSQISLAAANATGWNDGTVAAGTTSWYRVRAYVQQGTSGWSNVAMVTTPSGVPGAPTGLLATPASPTSVDLAWTAPAAGSPTSYSVEYRTGGGGWNFGGTASGTTFTVTGLQHQTAYEFRVTAYNAFGSGPASALASATTPSGLPGAPTGVSAVPTSPTSVDVSWTAPAVGSPTSYSIEYRTGGGGWSFGGVASGTTFTVTGLAHQTTYEFRVTAYNAFGNGPASALASATTPSGLPGAPTGVSAAPTSPTTVDVSWTAPAVGSPTSYSVEYRTGGGLWNYGGAASGTTFTVAGLQHQTTYEFRVTAYNAFGYGPASALATATTPSGLPGAPTGVSAVATSPTTVDLSWTAPAFGAVMAYIVEYRTGGGLWAYAGNASGTGFTVAGLQHQTTYDFQVTAFNAFGYGPASAPASATTPSGLPGAPTGLVAQATSSTTIDLAWMAPASGDATAFAIEYSVGASLWSLFDYAQSTAYVAAGLAPGTTYSFRVFSANGFGLSASPSNVASATTSP